MFEGISQIFKIGDWNDQNKLERIIKKTPPKNTFQVVLYGKHKLDVVKATLVFKPNLQISCFHEHDALMSHINHSPCHLVLVDITHPENKPFSIIEDLKDKYDDLAVIGLAEQTHVQTIVKAVKMGLHDVIDVDQNPLALEKSVRKQIGFWDEKQQGIEYRRIQRQDYDFSNIVGNSPPMQQVFQLLKKIIRRKWVTVMILGETGTGKELIARAIHHNTCNEDEPFVELNCNAFPETLVESELFGHEKGAFTDAKSAKMGMFELAHHGTLFLDEIGDISTNVQLKLLKAIEQKSIRRVGGTKDVKVHTRIITSTNRDLQEAMESGEFRRDLYYRLNVAVIHLPPLRERGDDVVVLAEHFLQQFSQEYESPVTGFTDQAVSFLRSYAWPGNVRELRHTIERLALLCDSDKITANDVEQSIDSDVPFVLSEKKQKDYVRIEIPKEGITLEDIERHSIQEMLEKTGWNKRRTAKILKISRPRLDRKIERYNLTPAPDQL